MSDLTSAKPVICDRCGTAIDFRIFPGAAHVIGEKNFHIGCVPTVPDPRDAEITKLKSQLEEARAKAILDCIAKVQQMHDGFLSPEYATGQPVSSITERITCRMIQDQLCALLHDGGKARSVLDAHKEGGKS